MTDNATLPATGAGSAVVAATRKVTYSGDANVDMQVVGLATLSGSDDAKVPTDVSTSNPLPVTGTVTVSQPAVVAFWGLR